jgi:glycosidase
VQSVAIEVRFRGEPGRRVELFGETSHWSEPHPLRETSPGEYSAVLDLPPGVYTCKVRIDDTHWRPAADLPIDHSEGLANSTLTVAGTRAPVYFAPSRHCWFVTSERVLEVRFEIESGTEVPTFELLTCSEVMRGQLSSEITFECANRSFVSGAVYLASDMAYARMAGDNRLFPLPAPEQRAIPKWLEQGIIYSIFVDRWHRAKASPVDPRAQTRTAPSSGVTFYGGDLPGIEQALGYLEKLGVTAIALTPLHCSPSPHHYDATNFARVDPTLGGERALDDLITGCHARGLAVVLDAAFTHCHADHPAFRDAVLRREDSRYWDWFSISPTTSPDPDFIEYDCYGRNAELPLLNFKNAEVRDHLIAVATDWFERGIDGVRLDAMEQIPVDFWQELLRRARSARSDAALLGECLIEPIARFLRSDPTVDAVTDFKLRENMLRALGTRELSVLDFTRRIEIAAHRCGPGMSGRRIQFLDNHDTDRFITRAFFRERLHLALTFMLLRPEVVWFYYGTEHGLTGGRSVPGFDNPWPDRLPMVPLHTETKTFALTRELVRLRRSLHREGYGDARELNLGDQLVAYERRSPASNVRVVLNNSSDPARLPENFSAGEALALVELEQAPDGLLPPNSGFVARYALT